jgi:tetratricopeptide (TPR) repeat protein
MTMLAEALARTSLSLREEREVDVGLDRLLSEPPPGGEAKWLEEVQEALRERSDSLRVARKELKRLAALAKHIGQILPFTAEGWPAERERLAEVARADPLDGVAAWLTDWFAAAARARLGALARLQTADLPLPAGSEHLLDRASMAALGIAGGSWHLVEPMLAAERSDLAVHGHRLALDDRQRRDLALLTARLAIACRLPDEAQAALERAEAQGDDTTVAALRNRLQRTTGAPDEAPGSPDVARRLAEARGAEPGNLDVVVELIRAAHDSAAGGGVEGSGVAVDAALDLARTTIDALDSLAEIEAELARVVTEVPNEIYLAIAERAIAERDCDRAIAILDMSGASDVHELNALAGEYRAQALAGQEGPVSERVRELAVAGDHRALAGQYDRARSDYESALSLDHHDVEAALGWADVVRLSSAGSAASALREPMRAVAKVVTDLRDRGGINTERSWGYLVESSAWMEAGRFADSERSDVLWRSLLAATRAAVHQPDLSSRWQAIADAAALLNMHETALFCAQQSARVEADLDPAPTLAMALGNASHLDDALAMTDEMSSSRLAPPAWISAVRAYLLLRQGDAEQALAVFQGVEIQPSWYWARSDFIEALIVLGQGATAGIEAESLLRDLEHSHDDYSALRACAFAANVCGRPEDALRWAEQLRDADPHELAGGATARTRAEAALVQGNLDVYLEEMQRAVSGFSLGEAGEWAEVTRKHQVWLSQQAGVPSPDLAGLEVAVTERIAALSQLDSPRELTLAADEQEHGPAETARGLLLPLLFQAQGDPDAAHLALDDAESHSPGDPELAKLRENLSRSVEGRSAEGRVTEPPDAAPDPPDAGPVASQAEVRLELPPSWFTEFPDPLAEHPLFLRFLPEMRARIGRNGPALNVNTNEDLEPDNYVILIGDEEVAAGRVAREWRYCPAEAVALMPAEVGSCFERDSAMGLMRIPADRVDTTDSITQLLLMSAEEVVARIVGDTAARRPERIWGAELAGLQQA